MCKLEFQDILKILPHRHPFIFIDKIIKYKREKYIIAVKNIKINNFFFKGHFPGYPIFPGVLILESVLQTACVLIYKSMKVLCKEKVWYVSNIDYAKFKKKVFPGDMIVIYVNISNFRNSVVRFFGDVLVNKKLACRTKMSVMYHTKL
ncbi:MAG: 3-hydroxyacyl-ACP dehydratase FabZ [Buchnera aphidicola (Nurudea yanoniella)]